MAKTRSLKLPYGVKKDKRYREILRVFRRQKRNGGELSINAQPPFADPVEWLPIIVSVAKHITLGYAPPMPAEMRDKAGDALAAQLLSKALEGMLEQAEPNSMTARLIRSYGAKFGASGNPLVMPDGLVEAHPNVEQVMAIWNIPEHTCDSCDELHPNTPVVLARKDRLKAKEWGETLGHLSLELAEGDSAAHAEIVNAFSEALRKRDAQAKGDGSSPSAAH